MHRNYEAVVPLTGTLSQTALMDVKVFVNSAGLAQNANIEGEGVKLLSPVVRGSARQCRQDRNAFGPSPRGGQPESKVRRADEAP